MDRDEYFDLLGLSKTIRSRLVAVESFYVDLLPDPIDYRFASETVDDDGQRLIENYWVITKKFVCEAHTVLSMDDFDVASSSSYYHWFVKKSDFTPGESTTTKSRLLIEFHAASSMRGELKASGENCNVLWDIAVNVFLPNTR